MLQQVESADFVLLVITESYARRFRRQEPSGTGSGVSWEGAIITQEIYRHSARNGKFIPVVFDPAHAALIPLTLASVSCYDISTEAGYRSLYRRLTKQHATPNPPLGTVRTLAPTNGRGSNPGSDGGRDALLRPAAQQLPHGAVRCTSDEIQRLIQTACRLHYRKAIMDEQVAVIARGARGNPSIALSLLHAAVGDAPEESQGVGQRPDPRSIWQLITESITEAVEAALVLRWVDVGSLQGMVGTVGEEAFRQLEGLPGILPVPGTNRLQILDRDVLLADLRRRKPKSVKSLHVKATNYFDRLQQTVGTGPFKEEILYHLLMSRSPEGLNQFLKQAESLAQQWMVAQLQDLVAQARAATETSKDAQLWIQYYAIRCKDLSNRASEARNEYRALLMQMQGSASTVSRRKLEAYICCDLGLLLSKIQQISTEGVAEAKAMIHRSLSLWPDVDEKLIHNHINLIFVFQHENDWNGAHRSLAEARRHCPLTSPYTRASIERNEVALWAKQGRWHEMYATRRDALAMISHPDWGPQRARSLANWSVAGAFAGRYSATEKEQREAIRLLEQHGEPVFAPLFGDLGLVLGYQGKLEEARSYFKLFWQRARSSSNPTYAQATIASYWGQVMAMWGHPKAGLAAIKRSRYLRQEILLTQGGQQHLLVWQGEAEERLGHLFKPKFRFGTLSGRRAGTNQGTDAVRNGCRKSEFPIPPPTTAEKARGLTSSPSGIWSRAPARLVFHDPVLKTTGP